MKVRVAYPFSIDRFSEHKMCCTGSTLPSEVPQTTVKMRGGKRPMPRPRTAKRQGEEPSCVSATRLREGIKRALS